VAFLYRSELTFQFAVNTVLVVFTLASWFCDVQVEGKADKGGSRLLEAVDTGSGTTLMAPRPPNKI